MSNQFKQPGPFLQQRPHRIQFHPIVEECVMQPAVKEPEKFDEYITIPLQTLDTRSTGPTRPLTVVQGKVPGAARPPAPVRFVHHEWFLPGLVILLGSFLSLFMIGSKSLWLDEAYSAQLVHSWQFMWSELLNYDRNAWFYYILLYPWSRLGESETLLRALSALFAIASLPVYYLLAKKLLDRKVALLATFLLAINGFYIRYAQEARAYSLAFLLTLLSTLVFLYLLHKPSLVRYGLYVLCTVLGIYAHAFTIFLLPIHGLIILFARRSLWNRYALCAIIIGAAAFPVVLSQGRAKVALNWLPAVHLQTPVMYFFNLASGQPVLFLLYAFLCSFATVQIVRTARKARNDRSLWKYVFVYSWLFVPLLLALGYSLLVYTIYSPRYLLTGLGPLLLLVSVGLTRIKRPLLYKLCLSGVVLFSLLSLVSWYAGNSSFTLKVTNKKEDWRTAVAYICTQSKANDSVTFYSYVVQIPYEYYSQRNGACQQKNVHKIQLAGSPFTSGGGGNLPAPNLELLKKQPASSSQVWLVVSHVGSHPQRVKQLHTIQQTLEKNYRLVSTKKFAVGIDVLLYARAGPQRIMGAEATLNVRRQ